MGGKQSCLGSLAQAGQLLLLRVAFSLLATAYRVSSWLSSAGTTCTVCYSCLMFVHPAAPSPAPTPAPALVPGPAASAPTPAPAHSPARTHTAPTPSLPATTAGPMALFAMLHIMTNVLLLLHLPLVPAPTPAAAPIPTPGGSPAATPTHAASTPARTLRAAAASRLLVVCL